jgi:hypothetical protein
MSVFVTLIDFALAHHHKAIGENHEKTIRVQPDDLHERNAGDASVCR